MSASESIYSHRLRIRVCGLLFKHDSLLLVQLKSPVTDSLIWTPPGGGLEFGETMHECLKREFVEETGLKIEVNHLVHVNEMIREPFHAIEFYFSVTQTGGSLAAGRDPELSDEEQLFRDIKWKPVKDIRNLRFAPESLADKVQNYKSSSSLAPIFSPAHIKN